MRLLTFNWHEAYLCGLAKTGHRLEIVERDKGGSRVWFYETRPVPSNATIVPEAAARRRARRGAYDAIVCHNVNDLLWAQDYAVPKILVFHNRLASELALSGNPDRDTFRRDVVDVVVGTRDVTLIFISDSKQRDWDLPGYVVTPGIDVGEYGGYHGADARVLRVGNFMRRRDVMLGHTAQLEILGDRPSTLLGLNEPQDGGRFTRSWDDLKEHFQSHRVFLNTTVEAYEDGYNLSMLEAMSTGMPIVSTANGSSPIVDGVNGFISDDRAYLSARIDDLLADRNLAHRLGAAARETVARAYPQDAFVLKWNALLARATHRTVRVPGAGFRVPGVGSGFGVSGSFRVPDVSPANKETAVVAREAAVVARDFSPAKKILLSYVSYPATTARYLESAFRRRHDVVTVGPAIDEGLIREWNLQDMGEPVTPHDIPTAYRPSPDDVFPHLAAGWSPDLYLWVESVPGHYPRRIPELGCPTACYLIDSHLNLPLHLQWAPRFDYVFVAQREYVEAFREHGCDRVYWLPLACDPEIHGPGTQNPTPGTRNEPGTRHPESLPGTQNPTPGTRKLHDIGFVGSLTKYNLRRQRLIDLLKTRFDVHVERSFLRQMASTFSSSRIVFNDAVKNDLNMRVFEAMCSGAMLLTDRAPGSGLDEMFVDRHHLAIYEDDTLVDLAAHYLQHADEREAIAARGRAEVLRWHTYDHRAASIVDTVFGTAADIPVLARVDDALLRDAMGLADAGNPRGALDRLACAPGGRALSPVDRYHRALLVHAAEGRLGMPSDAASVERALRDVGASADPAALAAVFSG